MPRHAGLRLLCAAFLLRQRSVSDRTLSQCVAFLALSLVVVVFFVDLMSIVCADGTDRANQCLAQVTDGSGNTIMS